jgi:dolichol-phosphate mannosyltransferase
MTKLSKLPSQQDGVRDRASEAHGPSGNQRVLVIIPVWNEEVCIGGVIEDLKRHVPYDILICDDGSTDRTLDIARGMGCLIAGPTPHGTDLPLRTGVKFGMKNGYDVIVQLGGSGKQSGADLPAVVQPVLDGTSDLVCGSRYLPGSNAINHPIQRRLGTRLYSVLFSLFAGRSVTDASNAWRAYSVRMLRDPRFPMDEPWVDGYGFEPCLYYKSIEFGYRVSEVPVTIAYPKRKKYSKIRFPGAYWAVFRPLLYMRLGIWK